MLAPFPLIPLTLHDVFVLNLLDLFSAENQLLEVLPTLSACISEHNLATALKKEIQTTKKHILRLEQVLQSSGIRRSAALSKGMRALRAVATINVQRSPKGVLRDLRVAGDAQRLKHFEIASYTSIISIAKTLGLADAANLFMESLQEELKSSELFSKLAKPLLHAAKKL